MSDFVEHLCLVLYYYDIEKTFVVYFKLAEKSDA